MISRRKKKNIQNINVDESDYVIPELENMSISEHNYSRYGTVDYDDVFDTETARVIDPAPRMAPGVGNFQAMQPEYGMPSAYVPQRPYYQQAQLPSSQQNNSSIFSKLRRHSVYRGNSDEARFHSPVEPFYESEDYLYQDASYQDAPYVKKDLYEDFNAYDKDFDTYDKEPFDLLLDNEKPLNQPAENFENQPETVPEKPPVKSQPSSSTQQTQQALQTPEMPQVPQVPQMPQVMPPAMQYPQGVPYFPAYPAYQGVMPAPYPAYPAYPAYPPAVGPYSAYPPYPPYPPYSPYLFPWVNPSFDPQHILSNEHYAGNSEEKSDTQEPKHGKVVGPKHAKKKKYKIVESDEDFEELEEVAASEDVEVFEGAKREPKKGKDSKDVKEALKVAQLAKKIAEAAMAAQEEDKLAAASAKKAEKPVEVAESAVVARNIAAVKAAEVAKAQDDSEDDVADFAFSKEKKSVGHHAKFEKHKEKRQKKHKPKREINEEKQKVKNEKASSDNEKDSHVDVVKPKKLSGILNRPKAFKLRFPKHKKKEAVQERSYINVVEQDVSDTQKKEYNALHSTDNVVSHAESKDSLVDDVIIGGKISEVAQEVSSKNKVEVDHSDKFKTPVHWDEDDGWDDDDENVEVPEVAKTSETQSSCEEPEIVGDVDEVTFVFENEPDLQPDEEAKDSDLGNKEDAEKVESTAETDKHDVSKQSEDIQEATDEHDEDDEFDSSVNESTAMSAVDIVRVPEASTVEKGDDGNHVLNIASDASGANIESNDNDDDDDDDDDGSPETWSNNSPSTVIERHVSAPQESGYMGSHPDGAYVEDFQFDFDRSQPAYPSMESQLVEPVQPAQFAQHAQFEQPAQPAQSTQQVYQPQHAQPAEQSLPVQPVVQPQHVQPAEQSLPVQPVVQPQHAQPAEQSLHVQPVVQPQHAQPAEQPLPDKTVQLEGLFEPTQAPVQPDSVQPEQLTQQAQPEQPAQQTQEDRQEEILSDLVAKILGNPGAKYTLTRKSIDETVWLFTNAEGHIFSIPVERLAQTIQDKQ